MDKVEFFEEVFGIRLVLRRKRKDDGGGSMDLKILKNRNIL